MTDYLINLDKIFKKLNWDQHMDEEDYAILFNKFAKLLSRLTEEQRRVILEITEDFFWIRHLKIIPYIKETIKKLYEKEDEFNEINILPLMADESKPNKSAQDIASSWNSTLIRNFLETKNCKVIFNKTYHDFNLSFNSKKKSRIILVDDYAGTGETIIKAVSRLTNKNINSNFIVVLVFVAQKEAIANLIRNKINCIYIIERGKGISDKYVGNELKEKIRIMESIEDFIKVDSSSDFRFGYKRSEGLIHLFWKIADNTFPFFWFNKSFSAKCIIEKNESPFYRDKI